MHAAEDDEVGIGFPGFLRKPQRIAQIVGCILYFGTGVVVSQDDGVFLFFEPVYLSVIS